MDRHAKVLIVEDEVATLTALQELLTVDGWNAVTAENAEAGLKTAREFDPDVIICDFGLPGMNGFELCECIKADPDTASALFVILTGYRDPKLKVMGLRLGVDDYLEKPVEAPELLAKAQAMLRIKRLHDELRKEKQVLQKMQQGLANSFNRLLSVLQYVLDLRVPGAATRGEHLASWAIKIAKRFEVPEILLDDLRLAARLHEIGRVVQAASRDVVVTDNGAPYPPDWAYTVATKAILEQVEHLQEAASLVGAIYENWDGTGMPNRWCMGQIPLRSRILRVLIDFSTVFTKQQAKKAPLDILEELSRYSGTRYDPVVLNHLAAVMANSPELTLADTKYRVVIGELEDGMVLAADLCSASGVKLLAAGSTVTSRILDLVRERDQSDPIIDAAWVQR